MLEAGQPLHAFDARRIASGRIVVRTAGEAGTLTTLDGSERALHPDDLLICDGGHAGGPSPESWAGRARK